MAASFIGCQIPTSDTDYKGVYLPSSEEILLGTYKSVVSQDTNNSKQKNTKDDIDYQIFSLQKFIEDLEEGESYAYEMIFSPKNFWVEAPDSIWLELVKNKDKFISKNVSAMVGYARKQARKYGDKGRRLEVFQDIVSLLESVDQELTLNDLEKDICAKFVSEFVSIHPQENDTSGGLYLDVGGVLVPMNCDVAYSLDIYRKHAERYGARARKALEDKGSDLKALYHALRISYQTEELLLTGNITLPRPESALLISIRNGQVSDLEIKRLIDEGFDRVVEAEKKSALQETPNKEWLKNFLMETHLEIIRKEKNLYKGWDNIPKYIDYDDVRND